MSRPTEIASRHFQRAMVEAFEAAEFKDVGRLAQAVQSLATGLDNMSTGLRATYVLLEEVKQLLQPQQFGRKDPAPGNVSLRDR